MGFLWRIMRQLRISPQRRIAPTHLPHFRPPGGAGPGQQIAVEDAFEQLGVDSLDAINLIYEIESDFPKRFANRQADAGNRRSTRFPPNK